MPKDQQAAFETLVSAFTVFVRECSKSQHPKNYITEHDLANMEHRINMHVSELGNSVAGIKQQIIKISTEQQARFDALSAKIAELEGKVTADPDIDPAIAKDLDDTKALLQALDDTIPDTTGTPPPAGGGNPTG